MSVVQGARTGLPMGPAGPHRLQVALRPGRGPELTGRPPGALQPMALGPAALAYWVPGTFSRCGSWRRTGRRVRASEHARRGHARGGQTGRGAWGSTRAGSEVTGTRGHCSAHRWAPGHARGPGRCRPAAEAPGAAAAHSPWHRRARPRAPWRPGILYRTGAWAPAAAARTVTLQPARQSASSRAPSPSLRDGSLCHMSLGTLPNTPTHAHTPTRPRTHRQGRAQTRAVAGTLASQTL